MNFTGLTGEQSSMDAGALSYEFFDALLKEASFRLLEGKEENLVPKRSGDVTNFCDPGHASRPFPAES